MVVEAAPANLTLSSSSLSYQASTTQNPPNRVITLQNSGGQPLDWSVSAGTVDGANWLSASPTSGHLESNAQANVSVSVNASTLKVGSYQGTLTFSYGTLSRQVAIALSVNAIPMANIGVQTNTLTFTATASTNPAPQTFSITNTGSATLNWSLTEDQNGTTFAPATPSSGSLAPGKSATITVTPKVTQANLGVIHAMMTVADSDPGTLVQSQKITVTITINAPLASPISLSPNTMVFANNSILNNTTELLLITNTGSTALDWSLTSSASWLSADANGGTLNPGESLVIDVTCSSSPLPPGTYQATLSLNSSNSGTPLATQTVNVTLTVST